MIAPAFVVLATDSPDPSGVGRHMLTLAAALAGRPGLSVRLAFPDHDAGARLAAEAVAAGLAAVAVPEDGWLAALAGADLVHVHAGIGWEGHDLVTTAREAGARLQQATEAVNRLIEERSGELERRAEELTRGATELSDRVHGAITSANEIVV